MRVCVVCVLVLCVCACLCCVCACLVCIISVNCLLSHLHMTLHDTAAKQCQPLSVGPASSPKCKLPQTYLCTVHCCPSPPVFLAVFSILDPSELSRPSTHSGEWCTIRFPIMARCCLKKFVLTADLSPFAAQSGSTVCSRVMSHMTCVSSHRLFSPAFSSLFFVSLCSYPCLLRLPSPLFTSPSAGSR